jgi:hypothetical protein
MSDYLSILVRSIDQVATLEQQKWLNQTLVNLDNSQDLDSDLLLYITRARRFVGHAPLSSSTLDNNGNTISTAVGDLRIQNWEAGNAARVVLLLKALSLQPERQEAMVTNAYRMSDESEKTALIAGIALYADDDRYKGLALDSGRTNSLLLFRALATNNPYPCAYYSDAEFNQLVLKSLFLCVNTEQIIGLENRVNQELSRMCEDYYDERVAAQRSVPADIWLSVTPYASEHGLEILTNALSDDDRQHRYYAAIAVNRFRPQTAELYATIEMRLDQETDEQIGNLLSSFLNH